MSVPEGQFGVSSAGIRATVALDASVLINLLVLDRTGLLAALPDIGFAVPEPVVAEIRRPDQARALQNTIASGHVRIVRNISPTELGEIGRLRRLIGHGEAACLALANARGLLVACDERGRFLRLAEELIGKGRILTTPGLIVLAIRACLITVEEADEMKATLERHRFRMPFGSFQERVS